MRVDLTVPILLLEALQGFRVTVLVTSNNSDIVNEDEEGIEADHFMTK